MNKISPISFEVNRNDLKYNPEASKLFSKVPQVLVEYYFNFLLIRDLSRLSLINKVLYLQAGHENAPLWKMLYNKFSRQNISYRFLYSLDGATYKNTLQRIYEQKKFIPNKLKAIFGEFERIMALPLMPLDSKLFGKRWSFNENPLFADAMKEKPTLCKISVFENPQSNQTCFIAIKLNAHCIGRFPENKVVGAFVVSGVCILWEYMHMDWKISFSWLTDKRQLAFNPGRMEDLHTQSQVEWFRRLLQGEICGYRMAEDNYESSQDEPKIEESFEEIYYTLESSQHESKKDNKIIE